MDTTTTIDLLAAITAACIPNRGRERRARTCVSVANKPAAERSTMCTIFDLLSALIDLADLADLAELISALRWLRRLGLRLRWPRWLRLPGQRARTRRRAIRQPRRRLLPATT